jgi:hypothetical protein
MNPSALHLIVIGFVVNVLFPLFPTFSFVLEDDRECLVAAFVVRGGSLVANVIKLFFFVTVEISEHVYCFTIYE